MIACIDVHYRGSRAVCACVLLANWPDATCTAELVREVEVAAPYEPGRFYLRELPCLLRAIEAVPELPDIIVIDGYVWLGAQREPGLGAHLYQALGQKSAVIGVAKSRYFAGTVAQEVFRGASRKPLYVTAVGMDAEEAARHIQEMHGKYRIPTLLKRVDVLSRTSTWDWEPGMSLLPLRPRGASCGTEARSIPDSTGSRADGYRA